MKTRLSLCALVCLAACSTGDDETAIDQTAEPQLHAGISAPPLGASAEASSPSMQSVQRIELRPGARPANVPAEFVFTPHGFVHPSCIYQLEPGERPEGHTIVKPDGTTRPKPPCSYSRFDAHGKEQAPRWTAEAGTGLPSTPQPGTGDMWDAWSYDSSQGAIGHLEAQWRVPVVPAADASTIIFLFSGLVPSAYPYIVLQNVLAWRGNGWVIESWQADTWGASIQSPSLPVNVGDLVVGFVDGQSCNPLGWCSTWKIETFRWGVASTWANSLSYFLVFDRIYGAVLEDDGLACVKFGPVKFTGIWARKLPSWTWVAPNLHGDADTENHGCTRVIGGGPPDPGAWATLQVGP